MQWKQKWADTCLEMQKLAWISFRSRLLVCYPLLSHLRVPCNQHIYDDKYSQSYDLICSCGNDITNSNWPCALYNQNLTPVLVGSNLLTSIPFKFTLTDQSIALEMLISQARKRFLINLKRQVSRFLYFNSSITRKNDENAGLISHEDSCIQLIWLEWALSFCSFVLVRAIGSAWPCIFFIWPITPLRLKRTSLIVAYPKIDFSRTWQW
jgi:hypothetical protein